jgi:hypothetical protein
MSDEARMLTELGRLGEDPLPGERSDADIVAAALAELSRAPVPVDGPTAAAAPAGTRIASRTGMAVGLLLAVAAAVLLGWSLLPRTGLLGERSSESGSMSPSLADDEPAGGRAVERDPDGRMGVGRDLDDGTPSHAGEPTEAPVPEPPTQAVAPPDPGTLAEPSEATTPELLAEDPGLARDPTPTTPPRATAPALLEHAQRLVSTGERAAAIAAYERLIARFPESREAKASQVSLGRLELDRGRAQQALARFDAYLAESAGALVEEARYGRIRALRQLGRVEQERRSIDAFLADHPDSLYAARLRKRAEELRAP